MGKQVIQRANKSPYGHSRGAAMLPRTTREANRSPVQRCERANLSWRHFRLSRVSPLLFGPNVTHAIVDTSVWSALRTTDLQLTL